MFADDLVAICKNNRQLKKAIKEIEKISPQLNLEINKTKSGIMPIMKNNTNHQIT